MPKIALYISHVYDNSSNRFSLFVGHQSKTQAKMGISQCGGSNSFIHETSVEEDNDSKYEKKIEEAIQNYVSLHFSNKTEDRLGISDFLYVGDCNLGYPNQTKFPDFLTNPSKFLQLLFSNPSEKISSENVDKISNNIRIKRFLNSASQKIIIEAKNSFPATDLYQDTFYLKGTKLQKLFRSSWSELTEENLLSMSFEEISQSTRARTDSNELSIEQYSIYLLSSAAKKTNQVTPLELLPSSAGITITQANTSNTQEQSAQLKSTTLEQFAELELREQPAQFKSLAKPKGTKKYVFSFFRQACCSSSSVVIDAHDLKAPSSQSVSTAGETNYSNTAKDRSEENLNLGVVSARVPK